MSFVWYCCFLFALPFFLFCTQSFHRAQQKEQNDVKPARKADENPSSSAFWSLILWTNRLTVWVWLTNEPTSEACRILLFLFPFTPGLSQCLVFELMISVALNFLKVLQLRFCRLTMKGPEDYRTIRQGIGNLGVAFFLGFAPKDWSMDDEGRL